MTTHEFLHALYGDAPGGFLTIWTLPDKKTAYFPAADLAGAAVYTAKLRDTHDVYFGAGLREKERGPFARGGSDDVTLLPGFWHDLDIAGPAHKQQALPADEMEAFELLNDLPYPPSLVVRSGHGLHAYWLFGQPLVLTPETRAQVAAALQGWQKYVNAVAADRGWRLDNTSDFARVLRLPGSINHKNGGNAEVSVVGESANRFTLEEFLPCIEEAASENPPEHTAKFTGAMGPAKRMINGCAFIRHCRDNAASLTEPYWYAMLSNLALCADGSELCHRFSEGYPGYTSAETDGKIAHAIKAAKPCTCKYIKGTLGFDCGGCAAGCKAPAALALQTKADTVRALLEAEIDDYNTVYTADFIAALSYAKANLPGEYARFRQLHKGKISVRDLERCIKAHDDKARRNAHSADDVGDTLLLHGIDLNGAVVPRRWDVSVKDGVRRGCSADEDEESAVACPVPVVITRSLVNLDSGKERLELSFWRDNRWKSVVCNRTTVYNKASILTLGDVGLHVTSGTAPLLVDYLSDYETANIKYIPRVASVSRLGWLDDRQFFPYAVKSPVIFEEDKGTAALYHNLAPYGDFDAWKNMMRKLRKNPVARFITSASFASPLLCKMGVRPFVIHNWHMSASGKSAALKAAISVWGNPLKLMGSGFTTMVGMEQMAGTLRHLPFGIDEKQAADERRLSLSQLVYVLAQGCGKLRGAKTGGNAETAFWHNIIIMTGEEPITKSSSMDGIQTRCFELYGKPVDDVEFAKEVHIVSENNCGHAGEVFMKAVCGNLENEPDMLRELYGSFSADLAERGLRDIHADYAAAVAVGDYLAETVIFGTDEQTARREALQCAEEIHALNATQLSSDTTERAWEFIRGWLVGNDACFDNDAKPCYGRAVRFRAHFEYAVIPQYLDEALEKAGFNVRKTFQGLREKGLVEMQPDSEGKLRTKTKIRVGEKTLWGYRFRLQRDSSPPPEDEEDDFLK